MKLHEILRREITQRSLTIKGLSEKTGVPVQTLNNWLDEKKPRNVNQVKAVADFFGLSIDYLLFGEPGHEGNAAVELMNIGPYEVFLKRFRR